MSNPIILSPDGRPVTTKGRTAIKIAIIDQAPLARQGNTHELGVVLDGLDRAEAGKLLSTLSRNIFQKLEEIGYFDRPSAGGNSEDTIPGEGVPKQEVN